MSSKKAYTSIFKKSLEKFSPIMHKKYPTKTHHIMEFKINF